MTVLKFGGSRDICDRRDPQPSVPATLSLQSQQHLPLPEAPQLPVNPSGIKPGFGSSLWALPGEDVSVTRARSRS